MGFLNCGFLNFSKKNFTRCKSFIYVKLKVLKKPLKGSRREYVNSFCGNPARGVN